MKLSPSKKNAKNSLKESVLIIKKYLF